MSGEAFGAATPTGACPCGSLLAYAVCCGPLLTGERHAETAEALMRSRYTAFAVADGGVPAAHLAPPDAT